MFSYIAYGLGIRSVLPLPELVPEERATDVVVRWGRGGSWSLKDTSEDSLFATAEKVDFFWKEVGAISVRGGNQIVVNPVPGVDERVLRPFILGPVLAALLEQRGRLVLHASAVNVAGGAVAFLGESGRGKSTIAAALHARGYGTVADDVVAVGLDSDHPMVFPGFPRLKLWPESIASLGEWPEALPRVLPHLEKRSRCVARGFSLASLPLRCIYVLAEGEIQKIETLRPMKVLVELARHSYGAQLLQIVNTPSHFLRCTSLADSVTVRTLRRPRSISALPDLARLVEEDLLKLYE